MSGERARLFVALELPGPAREAIVAWRGAAIPASPGLRFTPSEYLHATLCFLGSQPDDQIPAIAHACELTAPAQRLLLGEPVWLPPRRPHVLALGLEDPDGTLVEIQAALSASLAAGGWYTPETRPFLAHITVARAGRGARLPCSPLPAPSTSEFLASRVTLYRSRLGPKGARYEALASVALG